MERLCAIDEMFPGTARRFDIGTHRIALVRIGDAFYAVGDRCSHADFSLSEGEVWPEACEIECWKHGSTFSLLTGEPQSLPATTSIPVYSTWVRDGAVWVQIPEVPMEGGADE